MTHLDALPELSGSEVLIREAVRAGRGAPVFGDRTPVRLADIDAACAIALHMHQPLIPAGGGDLRDAAVVSNLWWMMDHQDSGDNHNAPAFRWCYARMAEFVPRLLAEGYRPRVMLDYSGTLLHGLRQMGADDVLDGLRRLATEPDLRDAVEWLGCPWGHAVAPSTPVQDYRLHVRAWQHHFAALFGAEALGRVRGFSPAEMALPNHPDIGYEFVRTLTDCGFDWVLVQEHTVELPDGRPLDQRHVPYRLVCTSSRGETAEMVAVVKTQGSDTKLVAQMQPYYEAKGLRPVELAGRRVPQLVTQIADGENGGVMMNEFPPKYLDVVREASGTRTPMMNVSEYLEQLDVRRADLPVLQPVNQHRIWAEMSPGDGPARLAEVIAVLHARDGRFNVEGGSWTSDISWVRGYEDVLAPMERASSLFAERMASVPPDDARYRAALFHLLAAETSCYRYWGTGLWTDYGAELSRRAIELTGQVG
ncbi:MAG: hypothetical protein V7603_4760 [Micromonosporaceae bacterium]